MLGPKGWYRFRGEDLRLPMLDDGWCGVNNSSIHIEEKASKGHLLRRQAIVWLRPHPDNLVLHVLLGNLELTSSDIGPLDLTLR